jgi:hypothetical protein
MLSCTRFILVKQPCAVHMLSLCLCVVFYLFLTVTTLTPHPHTFTHTHTHFQLQNTDQSSSHLLVSTVRPLLSILMAQNCYCPQPRPPHRPHTAHTVSSKGTYNHIANRFLLHYSQSMQLCLVLRFSQSCELYSEEVRSAELQYFLSIILLFTSLCFTLSARIPQQVFLEYESGRGGNDLGCLPGSLEDVFEATISFRLAVLWCVMVVVWCGVK